MTTKKTKQVKATLKPSVAALEVPSVAPDAPLRIDAVTENQENEPQEKLNKRLFIFGGIVLGIIVIATAALFIFSVSQGGKEEIKEIKTEVAIVPTETPKPVLIRGEWSFEVLNGSGTSGVAKKAADKLEALGYKVISIDNADRQTYKGNGLFVSQEMMSKVGLVTADLKDTLTIATVAGVLKDSTASARVIIGREE